MDRYHNTYIQSLYVCIIMYIHRDHTDIEIVDVCMYYNLYVCIMISIQRNHNTNTEIIINAYINGIYACVVICMDRAIKRKMEIYIACSDNEQNYNTSTVSMFVL
jgi:hypothetical protein